MIECAITDPIFCYILLCGNNKQNILLFSKEKDIYMCLFKIFVLTKFIQMAYSYAVTI